MKKLIIVLLVTTLIPTMGMAMKNMNQENDHANVGHGTMAMDGVQLLQEEVVEGVKATAHLMDSKDGKGKMLMIMFTDEKSGAMISEGRVAVKIESPDSMVSEAQKMTTSDGMFASNVNLDLKGTYRFKVGTQLQDGKKRLFQFHHEV